jgi:hypothetical protein
MKQVSLFGMKFLAFLLNKVPKNTYYPIANPKLNIYTKSFYECITRVPRDLLLLWTILSEKLENVSVLHEWIISPKSHNIGFIELLDLHN